MSAPKLRNSPPFLAMTTDRPEGYRVKRYLGVVSAQAVMGVHIFSDLMAAVSDVVGGRSFTYETEFKHAKDLALEEMQGQARALGGNGVLGVQLDFEAVNGRMLLVSACGTAVVLARTGGDDTEPSVKGASEPK